MCTDMWPVLSYIIIPKGLPLLVWFGPSIEINFHEPTNFLWRSGALSAPKAAGTSKVRESARRFIVCSVAVVLRYHTRLRWSNRIGRDVRASGGSIRHPRTKRTQAENSI